MVKRLSSTVARMSNCSFRILLVVFASALAVFASALISALVGYGDPPIVKVVRLERRTVSRTAAGSEDRGLCVCITFISCARRQYLNRTLPKLMRFVRHWEQGLCFELHWIDQGMVGRRFFVDQFRFHKVAFYHRAQGYPVAFLQAFAFCSFDYIFLMEEDWLLKEHVRFPFISLSLELLAAAPESLYGILLRDLPVRHLKCYPIVTRTFGPWHVWAFTKQIYQFNNGATIYRMANIRKMLKNSTYKSELQFGELARGFGYHFGFYCRQNSRRIPVRSNGVFMHIGARSSIHSDICRSSVSFG